MICGRLVGWLISHIFSYLTYLLTFLARRWTRTNFRFGDSAFIAAGPRVWNYIC